MCCFDLEYQGTSLPLYLIILIVVLPVAVVCVVIAVVLCKKETKKGEWGVLGTLWATG